VLFEMGGVNHEVAKEAMRLAAAKLPIKTRFLAVQEHQAAHATPEAER
jgi:large subunit ribosomal protein L16